jgi:CRISPR-associated protein Cas2
MIVITVTNCPPALRGDLTTWLQEIDTGVYVGHVSARVREEIWERVCGNVKSGKALMVFSVANEQRMDFRVHNALWEPIDFDGLKLIMRPSVKRIRSSMGIRQGFSKAARFHKVRQINKNNLSRLLDAEKSASKNQYIIVDIETSGLSPLKDHILEIGAVKVTGGEITRRFQVLIQSNIAIPPAIQALTGIKEELLAQEGIPLEQALKGFLDFAENLPVVAHNAGFDIGFLRAACTACKFPLFSNPSTDTYSLARRLLHDVNNFKLQTLAEYFDIRTDTSHRSMADCLVIKQLYDKLIEIRDAAK